MAMRMILIVVVRLHLTKNDHDRCNDDGIETDIDDNTDNEVDTDNDNDIDDDLEDATEHGHDHMVVIWR